MDFGWLTWLWIIPVLGLLVFVHELGHFVTARMNGIRVDEFGFGYPPRLFGIKRKGVVYSINLLPLGGFVRIHGENGENQDDPDAFGSKAPWRRAIVLVAGSFMNIVLALVIFVMLAMIGIPSARGAQIDAVSPGSPAALAGFRLGDEVKTIAGVAISTPEDIADAVAANLDKPTTVVLLRNGQEVGATVTPRSRPPANQGAMGVTIGAAEIIKTRYNPVEAVWVGVQRTLSTTLLMVEGVSHLIGTLITTGSVSGVAVPVGIAQVTS
ncbi:MAG: site-2 protease family protein, partial [Chloroflexia bacterium]